MFRLEVDCGGGSGMLKNAESGGDVAKFGRGLAVGCCREVAMTARFSLV